MDQAGRGTPGGAGATSRRPVALVWWLLVLGAVTTAGLGALTLGLLVLHALGYGVITVVAPEARAAAPDSSRYVVAFAVGVLVHAATASASTWLAPRTAIRTWRPAALAVGASLVAATFATCALLLTLGLSPVAFLLDR